MSCGGGRRRNLAIPTPNYNQLAKNTTFSKADLKQIFSQFEDIADAQRGLVTRETFLAMPEVVFFSLAALVFDRAKNAESNALGFDEFVQVMNIFSTTINPGLKLRCKT
jgi:Ca2+-binding EF-hand superfamily protein